MRKYHLLRWLTGLVVLLVLVLIAAVVYPAPILRFVFSRVEAESGIALTFDRAYFYINDGPFLAINGLTVKRHNHHASNFDLKAETVRMPAMVPADFYTPILHISGLRGTVERVGNEKNDKEKSNKDSAKEKDIPIRSLMLADAEVEVIDRIPEKPFRATIQIKEFSISQSEGLSLFAPFECKGLGHISSGAFGILFQSPEDRRPLIRLSDIPINLFAPYAPVLDDIFDSGSVHIEIVDQTDTAQKKMRIALILSRDCRIKSADEILAPAIQSALQSLDQSSLPDVQGVKTRIEKLKAKAETIRTEVDGVFKIIDTFKLLAPPDVRTKYEKVKSRYDQIRNAFDESNTKFDAFLKDLDQVKISIVEDTFQHFIQSGIPIEIELQEVNGEWEYDAYETVVRLVEKNYRTILETQFQKRIQEMRDAVDRLLMF